MLKQLLGWTVSLFASVLLIQIAADVLYMRATGYKPEPSDDRSARDGRPGPVHEIEREASSGGIIT
jgi:hypothetical protein